MTLKEALEEIEAFTTIGWEVRFEAVYNGWWCTIFDRECVQQAYEFGHTLNRCVVKVGEVLRGRTDGG